ncbi:MAG: glycosyltransferase [Ilumatobacteraceae bacterium]
MSRKAESDPSHHSFVPRAHARRIGMLGTYPPRLCGLATFGAALAREFTSAGAEVELVVAEDGNAPAPGAPMPRHALRPGDAMSRRRAAATLSSCDVAVVQHEFGIYGGLDGDELLDVLDAVEAPIVVVLHTVPAQPTDHQRTVLDAVCAASDEVVVMSTTAAERLTRHDVDMRKVRVIPHGAWSLGRGSPVLRGPTRLLTWGLLGPGKGVEHMIDALALLGDDGADVTYTVAGVTHPNVRARHGDAYRNSLIRRADDHGIASKVHFDDSYRDLRALAALVTSASVVVLPYDSTDQVTSGVLADAIAAGVPVIATAFPHAVELLSDGAGIVVPHRDPQALAAAVRSVVLDRAALQRMTNRARDLAPSLAWSTVAGQYLDLIDALRPADAVAASR